MENEKKNVGKVRIGIIGGNPNPTMKTLSEIIAKNSGLEDIPVVIVGDDSKEEDLKEKVKKLENSITYIK